MNKCPRCELNYKKDEEQYCAICNKEMMGKDDSSDFDVCILCGSGNVLDGENICESCMNKRSANDSIDDTDEFVVDVDGYSDLIDTDIPDSDLKIVVDDEDEFEEQEEFDEE